MSKIQIYYLIFASCYRNKTLEPYTELLGAKCARFVQHIFIKLAKFAI